MTVAARNPRLEAEELLGGRYAARVLEPSPPAVDDGDFFADDPAARGEDPDGRSIVGPTSGAEVQWQSLCADDPTMAAWCAERWLGSWARLGPLPCSYAETCMALRRLAVYVLAPARKAVNGKIGLRYTGGGFGTPFFGQDEQLRVDGATLVRQRGSTAEAVPITSLAAAAAFADVTLSEDPGVGRDLPGLGDVHAPLGVDPVAASAVSAFFGFSASVLEEFRASSATAGRGSRVQLWPEHFDLGWSLESFNLGCSPGDEYSAEPYVYVGPWNSDGLTGDFWNAPFGAALRYKEVLDAADQRGKALAFLRQGLEMTPLPDDATGRLTHNGAQSRPADRRVHCCDAGLPPARRPPGAPEGGQKP